MSERFVTLEDAVKLLQAASGLDTRTCKSRVNWVVTQYGCRLRRGPDGVPFRWNERDRPHATSAIRPRASCNPHTAGIAKSNNSAWQQVSEWDKFCADPNNQVDFDAVCTFLETQEGLKLSIRTIEKGDRGSMDGAIESPPERRGRDPQSAADKKSEHAEKKYERCRDILQRLTDTLEVGERFPPKCKLAAVVKDQHWKSSYGTFSANAFDRAFAEVRPELKDVGGAPRTPHN